MKTEQVTSNETQIKKTPNKLINEKSPYLLQHAFNPVKWYPWGTEAFDLARKENKPIFLSIGYSTCHWCHVMENESFEDEEVASLLNESFVSIKVDKEERPDIDAIYMSVCQAYNGRGGWPLTILMTPDQKPFFAGTYFPKNAKYNLFGLMDILLTIKEKWEKEQDTLIRSGEEIANALNNNSSTSSDKQEEVDLKGLLHHAYKDFHKMFDIKNGGFGSPPKFPTPHNLLFLLRYGYYEQNADALSMVEKTLIQMFRGGIYDHIGYGFSRYSTDKKWLVPHFEKMLYDNAQLLLSYLEAYQITNNHLFKDVVINTLDYVVRELRDEEGGFYCAQDADSEGIEGKYYVFEKQEILSVLGKEDGEFLCKYFDVTEEGNFEGKNILNLLDNTNYAHEDPRIPPLRVKLYQYRLERTKLHKDDKILTSWNSLMIISFIKAYQILQDEEYLLMAERAVQFILENLTDENKDIYTSYRESRNNHHGIIDDYAFLTWALLEMYEVTYEAKYLKEALFFNKKMIKVFFDHKDGGFYINSLEAEQLILRPKEIYDGAIPSGNSVACYCLGKLARITSDIEIQKLYDKQLDFMIHQMMEYPVSYTFGLLSILNEVHEKRELICVVKSNQELDNIQSLLRKKYLPNTLVIIKQEDITEQSKEKDNLEDIIPLLKNYHYTDKKTTFYLCRNYACSVPIHDFTELERML